MATINENQNSKSLEIKCREMREYISEIIKDFDLTQLNHVRKIVNDLNKKLNRRKKI